MFQYLRLCVVGWFRSRILQTQSSRTISFLAIDCINLFLDFGFLFLFFGLHEAQGRMCWWPCYYGSFDSEVWSNHAAWSLQWIQTSIPDLPIYNEYFGIAFIRKKLCRYHLRPKQHQLSHVCNHVLPKNPRYMANFLSEDFIYKAKCLAEKCHALFMSKQVLQRYAIGACLRWRDMWKNRRFNQTTSNSAVCIRMTR